MPENAALVALVQKSAKVVVDEIDHQCDGRRFNGESLLIFTIQEWFDRHGRGLFTFESFTEVLSQIAKTKPHEHKVEISPIDADFSD